LNGGTNTFKDVAASMAASVFKENGISKYCLASTGNTATAYSKYLTKAGIEFTVFVPNCVNQDTVEEIKSHHQHIVVSDGDYSYAKKLAAEFHKNNGVLISGGNIDPIRVEAKKTMVFEFMRQLGKMPDIYLQAVSGGTGPISIDKGVREIKNFYPEVKLPKMFLVQQDTCNPMVQGWNNAVKNGFPEGYEKDYPAIDNPQTKVSILSTGNPGMFPIVAPIVKKSNGTFLCVKESELLDYARMIKKERNIILGPASIVCFSGFFEALAQNKIENGQTVLINTGEGAARSKDFAQAI
jgi:threonine synthase